MGVKAGREMELGSQRDPHSCLGAAWAGIWAHRIGAARERATQVPPAFRVSGVGDPSAHRKEQGPGPLRRGWRSAGPELFISVLTEPCPDQGSEEARGGGN